MKLVKYLSGLGYGSRKEVEAALKMGRVTHADGSALGKTDTAEHSDIRFDGETLDPAPGAVIMLNKPVGYTCSREDNGQIIHDLLPPRFMGRKPALSTIGRLDKTTSGLLLLTDDGQLLHRLISPKSGLEKVYEAQLARPLEGHEAELFASGELILRSETKPLRSVVLDVLGPQSARLTLTEGRYHQVRRMFAAAGNHVERLHRIRFGPLELSDLDEGAWRLLREDEVTLLA